MTERRAATRVSASSLVLLLDAEDRPTRRPSDRVWMVDISTGGLSVHVPEGEAPEVDDLVTVELPLGTSQSRVKTRCRVCAVEYDESTGPVARLAFLDQSDLFARTLGHTVSQLDGRGGPTPSALPAVWHG